MGAQLRQLPRFKGGPFSDAHAFWATHALVPYDSHVTVWRTPPGCAPGTLALALKAAASPAPDTAASVTMGFPAAPAVGTPLDPRQVPAAYQRVACVAPVGLPPAASTSSEEQRLRAERREREREAEMAYYNHVGLYG